MSIAGDYLFQLASTTAKEMLLVTVPLRPLFDRYGVNGQTVDVPMLDDYASTGPMNDFPDDSDANLLATVDNWSVSGRRDRSTTIRVTVIAHDP